MPTIHRGLRWGVALIVLILAYNALTMQAGTRNTFGVIVGNILHGQIGTGMWNGVQDKVDLSQLEPGDIILGHNPGCSWGYYTHATLYLGDGQVMETLLTTGVQPISINRYRDYTSAAVLSVNLPREVKEQAVRNARSLQGRPFLLLAPRGESGWFYCTKAVWWAYKQAGYDLDPLGGYWVVPDRFPRSPYVTKIAEG